MQRVLWPKPREQSKCSIKNSAKNVEMQRMLRCKDENRCTRGEDRIMCNGNEYGELRTVPSCKNELDMHRYLVFMRKRGFP